MSIETMDIDRLLEGIARSLSASVLPLLTDRYASMQVNAAVECLQNLRGKVEWRCDRLNADADAAFAAVGLAGPEQAGIEHETMPPHRRVEAAYAAVADRIRSVVADAATEDMRGELATIWDCIEEAFRVERSSVVTGMLRQATKGPAPAE